MNTKAARTTEQNERVEIIRAINDEFSAGLEIRNARWERCVYRGNTASLQSALKHLQEARRIIQTVGGGANEGGW